MTASTQPARVGPPEGESGSEPLLHHQQCGVSTGIQWEAPFNALEAADIEPILVHAQHVKQLKGRKTDVADSIWLARICQFGLCSPSMVPPEEFRDLRRLSRTRRQVVGDRSCLRNRIHKIIDVQGIRVGGVLSDLFGVNGLRILEGLAGGTSRATILASLSRHVQHRMEDLEDALANKLSNAQRFILRDLLVGYHQAGERIAEYDRMIAEGLAMMQDELDILQTIPGIDHQSACAILVELGPDINVFRSDRECAAWAGLAPGNNESAGKRRSGRSRKGNSTLREVLIECAHGAIRTNHCQFKGYHKALAIRRGHKRALVATAHKMLRVIFCLLKTGQPYQDPEIDHEQIMVMRNAPRWVQMLRKYDINPLTGRRRQRPKAA